MEPQWPKSHAEQTDVLTPVSRPPTGEEPTVRLKPATPPPPSSENNGTRKKPNLRKVGLITAAVFGALAVLYSVDLILSTGEVPRGVTVVGVDVGGENRKDAEAILRDRIEPRLTEPVAVHAGDVDTQIKPADAGLTIDWTATLDRAGDQPLNPITRLTSFFTTHEVGIVTTTDDAALAAAVDALRAETDRKPAEGGIRWEGITPVAIEPKQGQKLDAAGARQALINDWATGRPVELPVDTTPVRTTLDGVKQAIEDIAKPAVSGPVTVHGDGKDATLTPKHIARALVFTPAKEGGGLTAKINHKKVVAACKPQLASTEVEGKDAEIVFTGGSPSVTPSVDGKGVDWKKSFAPLMDVLKRTENRELDATYTDKPAKVTTEEAKKLGIKEVVSEYTTGGFAADSGVNIRMVAEEVNGAIVAPGETFSLNGHTGPRTEAQGYVAAGIIKNGAPARAVGGGISQFATTLYNAAYFAAMTDAGHREHSYYISRYPAAREATVFQNPDGSSVIDLKFTNDTDTGIAIQTIWTSDSITVRFWGTKKYDVESIAGGRGNFTEPEVVQGPDENCHPSNGAKGFTTSDTRIVRDAASGAEISRHTRTVTYNPQPKVVCTPPD